MSSNAAPYYLHNSSSITVNRVNSNAAKQQIKKPCTMKIISLYNSLSSVTETPPGSSQKIHERTVYSPAHTTPFPPCSPNPDYISSP